MATNSVGNGAPFKLLTVPPIISLIKDKKDIVIRRVDVYVAVRYATKHR